ncbi:universal stress protein [Flagellimonas pacifica]|uniref:Nucleotide-binding universal stress protein, UspA family n=1 Tax=Flagellimonas pacifica TaxID=1247520 RepID=A0A285MZ37_9FLAO|nr:universal stress protein [Allomuricauda parva]SNZ00741.1 Nucleotide-binding universal stress protein, UspA family [Allomuricauda parva]
MKQILIPTDFSNNAWNAITYGLNFLKDEQCNIHFLHAYTPAFYRMDYVIGGPTFSAIPDSSVELSLIGLEKTVNDVKEKFPNPNHKYNMLSSFNTLTDEIKNACEKWEVVLIVMGTQGATGAKEVFLGTNTVHTLRKAEVPVLAIPENCEYEKVKTILFPTDYLSDYKMEELGFLLNQVKTINAKVIVLHVNERAHISENQKKNKQLLAEKLKDVKHKFVWDNENLMPNAIHQFTRENDIDLLVMMNRKHNFFERLLIKPNVDTIGFHTIIPFLVIPDTAPIIT